MKRVVERAGELVISRDDSAADLQVTDHARMTKNQQPNEVQVYDKGASNEQPSAHYGESAITIAMTVPTATLKYIWVRGPILIGPLYTNRDDWRSQRNDWRKDSVNDWRKHRNDWNEGYAKENERKDYAKDRRFGDDCSVSNQAQNNNTNTYTNSYATRPCR